MLAWRELYFAPGFFATTAGKSPEWNRGAYLVEALGHCTDCHSPRNVMGAVKGKAQFTGAELDGFYAPDIASAALAETWKRATLTTSARQSSISTIAPPAIRTTAAASPARCRRSAATRP
jgi:mono/diheme cytochrome c family protein